MDYIMITHHFSKDFYIIPPYLLKDFAKHPLLNNLYITDIGHFIRAQGHFKERKTGINEAILIICESGKGTVFIEGQDFQIQPNEAVIIRPGAIHKYQADAQEPWTILWAHFSGSFVELFLNKIKMAHPIIHIEGVDLSLIQNLFIDIFNFLRKGYSIETMIYSSTGFNAILGKLIFGNPHFQPEIVDKETQRIERAIHYMLETLESKKPPTLNQLAAVTGLSTSHFSALFKEKTQFAPYDYFLKLKIQRACRYIENGSLNITQISQQFGYEDPYYFSRLFKKVMGISPSAFKKQQVPHRVKAKAILN